MIVEYTRYKIPKESIEFEVAYEKAQESLKVSSQCLRYEISHFAVYQSRETPNPKNLYFEFAKSFAKTHSEAKLLSIIFLHFFSSSSSR